MKKITVYKTTDGKIFESKEEAQEHELNLDIAKRLREHFEDHMGDDRYDEGYDVSDFVGYVISNKKLLKELIEGKYFKKV